MMMHLSPRALRHDRRGVGAVEFAFVAPLLALLMTGIFDLARAVSRKYELEQASYRALELLTAGSLQTDYAYLKPEAAAAAGEPQSNVDVANWLECNGTRQADFSGTCPTGQEVARFVKVTIRGTYKPFFTYGPLGRSFDVLASGFVRLSADSTLRVQ